MSAGRSKGEKVAHHKNVRGDAGLAEYDSLLDIADSEPASTLLCERPGDLHSAMAIGVRFHYRHHLDVRADCGTNGV